jgi:hypothetical protein
MSSINQQLSLFVPYMFPNITEMRVSTVFSQLHLGKVNHVDFIPKTDKKGRSYNAAYIHFDYWYEGSVVAHFQERVTNPEKEARLVYDEPWFWIVLENTAIKGSKAQETELVSSDYAAILEGKLAAAEKRIEDLEEDAWQRIAELEERVSYMENDGHEQVMRVLARREQTRWGSLGSHQVEEEDYSDMPALVAAEDYSDMPGLVEM